MDEHETVLSEVHIGLPVSSTSSNVISRFEFTLPAELSHVMHPDRRSSDDSSDSEDQHPPRREHEAHDVLLIKHHMATTLSDVGLQVWPAALTMADFLLSGNERFRDSVLLEIGGGVGLCGIVASLVAKKVICSDYKQQIVNVMEANFKENSHLLRCEYECAVLDVAVAEVVECDFLFGSDLIYDDETTDRVLDFVRKSLQGNAVAFFLSLEKRLNFTTDHLEVCCPAYRHFRDCCDKKGLNVKNLELDNIPKYFKSLPRSSHVELLEMTLVQQG